MNIDIGARQGLIIYNPMPCFNFVTLNYFTFLTNLYHLWNKIDIQQMEANDNN